LPNQWKNLSGQRISSLTPSKATHSLGDALFPFILEGNQPAALFCVVLVTFLAKASTIFTWSPAKQQFCQHQDVSYMEIQRRMCSCFSPVFVCFVSLVLSLCFRYSSRL